MIEARDERETCAARKTAIGRLQPENSAKELGTRIEPLVSEPSAICARPPATARPTPSTRPGGCSSWRSTRPESSTLDGAARPGAIIRINADGSRTTLASAGLEFPLGMTVAKDGSVYASNFGVIPASGGPIPGISGQVVRVSDPVPQAGQLGANLGGYRLAASDGGVFTYGAFGFYGSMGKHHLDQPVVGVASNPVGPGYWLVATDGGIFSFGTSNFYGSTGGMHINQPIVGMAPTPDGRGYWLVATDGGVFSFGDATFHGSTGAIRLNKPIVGMSATASGGGYDLFASDGGVFTFGDAVFHGSHRGEPTERRHRRRGDHFHGEWLRPVRLRRGRVHVWRCRVLRFDGRRPPEQACGGRSRSRRTTTVICWPRPMAGSSPSAMRSSAGSAGSLKLNNPVVGIG